MKINSSAMTEFNRFQQIKRNFFAMRNGIVADTIRRGGLQYKMIFGLNLPQIADIAATLQHSRELAEELWADIRTRESRLLSPMVYPRDELTRERAAEMLREAQTPRWPTSSATDCCAISHTRSISHWKPPPPLTKCTATGPSA